MAKPFSDSVSSGANTAAGGATGASEDVICSMWKGAGAMLDGGMEK
jgi:hypothetical protein